MVHYIWIYGVQITRSTVPTCGDVNVCHIHSWAQGQWKIAACQEAPKVVNCLSVCYIQLHIHFVLNWS